MNTKTYLPFVLALGCVALASADDAADFKKWYLAAQPTMKKAMEGKDIAYFNKISTADFTYTELGGKASDKKTAMSGLKEMMDGASKIKYRNKILGFKGLVVDVLNHYDLTMKPGADKKVHVSSVEIKSRETWVKQGGKWMLKNITDTAPAKMSMK